MVRPPRSHENSRSRSRSKGYGDVDRRPQLYADMIPGLDSLEPVTIRETPQQPPEQALASSMHNQALEFISVLKSLIEDTVNKGKQL